MTDFVVAAFIIVVIWLSQLGSQIKKLKEKLNEMETEIEEIDSRLTDLEPMDFTDSA